MNFQCLVLPVRVVYRRVPLRKLPHLFLSYVHFSVLCRIVSLDPPHFITTFHSEELHLSSLRSSDVDYDRCGGGYLVFDVDPRLKTNVIVFQDDR